MRGYTRRDEQRRDKFRELYLQTGNAVQSALAAGYSKATAQSQSYKFAQEIRVSMGEALRKAGLSEISQARKLRELQSARMPKWNPHDDSWDEFEDGHVQLEATKEISRLLDAYPAPKQAENVAPVTLVFPASFGAVKVEEAKGS